MRRTQISSFGLSKIEEESEKWKEKCWGLLSPSKFNIKISLQISMSAVINLPPSLGISLWIPFPKFDCKKTKSRNETECHRHYTYLNHSANKPSPAKSLLIRFESYLVKLQELSLWTNPQNSGNFGCKIYNWGILEEIIYAL